MRLKKTITIGPFGVQFINVNKPMGLPGHQHYAEISVELDTTGDIGYPSFEETNDCVYDFLVGATERAFRDATNEDVEERIFEGLCAWLRSDNPDLPPVLKKWGGHYRVRAMSVGVMGVRDKIGHAPGMTYYRLEREDL